VVRSGVCLLVAALLVSGCGYRFVGAKSGLGDVRSVAVDTPRNDSFQSGVEFLIADALRRELLRRGGADLSDDPDAADLVISGRVRGVSSRATSLSSVVLALEYEVTLDLELAARRRDGRALEDVFGALSGSERYLSSADAEAERKNRVEALRRVAAVVAARYFDGLSESLRP
jgi:hypothetical protein